jgi:hypothetical protein
MLRLLSKTYRLFYIPDTQRVINIELLPQSHADKPVRFGNAGRAHEREWCVSNGPALDRKQADQGDEEEPL